MYDSGIGGTKYRNNYGIYQDLNFGFVQTNSLTLEKPVTIYLFDGIESTSSVFLSFLQQPADFSYIRYFLPLLILGLLPLAIFKHCVCASNTAVIHN